MDFNKLKNITENTTNAIEFKKNKNRNILKVLSRFIPEKTFIENLINSLTINKSANITPDKKDGFFFQIVYDENEKNRPNIKEFLFQTNKFWYKKIENNIIRVCKYNKIEIYAGLDPVLISNTVDIHEDFIVLSEEELKLFDTYLDGGLINNEYPQSESYWGCDNYPHINDMLSDICKDYNIIGKETQAYYAYKKFNGLIVNINMHVATFESGKRYLVKSELRKLTGIRTESQFIKEYHEKTIDHIKQIDINENIEKLLCDIMSKKDYSDEQYIDFYFSLYGYSEMSPLEIKNKDLIIKSQYEAGIMIKINDNNEDILYEFPKENILKIELPEIILSYPKTKDLLYSCTPNITTKDIIHDDYDYDNWYAKIFEILDEQIANTGLVITDKQIIIDDDSEYYTYRIQVKNPVYKN